MGGLNNNEDLSDNSFIRNIRYRLFKQNKNWLGIVCGDTGSGKSYSALSLADIIVPRGITIKRNVVFNAVQFLQKLTDKSLQKGDILIFDEAGVGMSSREWYSTQNKLMGSVLQTFRNMNVGVIFTTPNLSFIDVQARKLFHNYIETANIDFRKNIATLKVYKIQHNSRLDKTYYKSPRFIVDGRIRKMTHLCLPKPKQYLIKEYEEAKTEYTQSLNAEALKELTGQNQPVKKEFNPEEIKNKILKDKNKYLKVHNNKTIIDIDLIRYDYNLPREKGRLVKKLVQGSLNIV